MSLLMVEQAHMPELIETGTNKAGTVAQIKNKRRSTKFISGHHHETPTSCEAWRGSRETI